MGIQHKRKELRTAAKRRRKKAKHEARSSKKVVKTVAPIRTGDQ